MDIPGSLGAKDCVTALGLEEITDRSWNIIQSNGLKGIGITEGLKWLIDQLDKNLKKKK